jgi:hypothetical protein
MLGLKLLKFYKMLKVKIKAEKTAHNRAVYAAPAVAGLAYKKTQSACGLCAFFLRHIFAVAGNLTVSFIATAKTSYTAGTLCVICPKILLKILKNI